MRGSRRITKVAEVVEWPLIKAAHSPHSLLLPLLSDGGGVDVIDGADGLVAGHEKDHHDDHDLGPLSEPACVRACASSLLLSVPLLHALHFHRRP